LKPAWRTCCVCLLLAAPLLAQTAEDPIDYDTVRFDRNVTAVRTNTPVTIDGRLVEPDWALSTPARDFIQWSPFHGEPAAEPSEVYFLFDDEAIYVGFVCFDSDIEHIVVNEIREDFNFSDTDGVTILIDSLDDDRSGFIFGTNPVGAKRDMQISNGTSINGDWDGVWEVEVTVQPDRWVAEFAIPFKTLRFSQADMQTWGLNLSRRVLRLNEESLWTPVPIRSRVTRVSLAGQLDGLEGLNQGMNLNVKPYVIGSFAESRSLFAGAPPTFSRDNNVDYGADLKYSLTPSLTLDATYNTDFAQVEADQQQVNLGRFNLFFPEKRDFFLENSGTFAFGGGGGFNNSGGPVVPFFSRRIGLDNGQPVPILGGARVSGQVGRFDVGFLTMRTEEQDDPSGGTVPADSFVVGRVKRNLLANSWIGGLFTLRDASDAGANRVYGADARFQFLETRLNFDSFLLASETPGLAGQNQSRKFQAGWNDDELDFNGGYLTIQPNFNPELGFVRRPDMTQYTSDATWSPRIDSEHIRNYSFGAALDYIEGASTGEIETRKQSADLGIQFQDNASASFGVEDSLERLSVPERVGLIPLVPAGDYEFRRYSVSASSDSSRKLSGSLDLAWGGYYDGTLRSLGGSFAIKPNYGINLELSWSHNVADTPYGDFTTDLVGARFVRGFSPRAFFNAFVQYNTATHQLSSNLRFNWTYSPLSDLYIVYNDTRDTDRRELSQRAVIVKFTKLLSF
jgi:Domain of unknown function (DUF5916)